MRTCTRVMGERAPWPGVQENLSSRFQPSSHRIRSAGTDAVGSTMRSPARRPTTIRALAQNPRCAAGVRACAGVSPDCRREQRGLPYVPGMGGLAISSRPLPSATAANGDTPCGADNKPHCVYHALHVHVHVQHRRRGRCTHTVTRPHPRTHTSARADTTTPKRVRIAALVDAR